MSDARPWVNLTAREKDARCARALGLTVREDVESGTVFAAFPEQGKEYECAPFTHPDSLAQARGMEDVIEWRGLGWQYAQALSLIVMSTALRIEVGSYGTTWACICATPDQRCEAACSVLEAR